MKTTKKTAPPTTKITTNPTHPRPRPRPFWTASDCWPNWAEAMDELGVRADTTDAELRLFAEREAPRAAASLGVVTDTEQFYEAFVAYRDELLEVDED